MCIMGQVIDITKLIAANKAFIQANKELKAVEAEIFKRGDRVIEGTGFHLIVKDGTIDIVQNTRPAIQNKDNNS